MKSLLAVAAIAATIVTGVAYHSSGNPYARGAAIAAASSAFGAMPTWLPIVITPVVARYVAAALKKEKTK